MEKDLVLSIDYGTQSVRVSIINKEGEFLAFEQEKYGEPYFSVKPGFCEQEPDFYYNCMIKAAKRLTSAHKDLLDRCMSISSTCFRDTPTFLDKDYKVIRPSIIWLDQRFARGDKKLPLLYRMLYKIVGVSNTIKFNRLRTPAMWLQENEPENYAKIRWYAPLNTYLNYKMLGVLSDSASNMIGHYPIMFKNGKVHNKHNLVGICYGIDPYLIPKISKVGEVIGHITKECSYETGFPEGLPFITTGSDKSCEALGSGSIYKGSAHISYGTASTISVFSKKYFSPETFLPSYTGCVKGYYNSEVQIYRGYWMLKWFSDEFANQENIEAKIEHLAVEEVLNKKLMEIAPGSDGLILQPYWGPGLLRPLAKGAIIGFYDIHTRYHVYKSIIEGIAYALKEGLESISKNGHLKVKYLTISGGGSRSDSICQITSDIFGLDVYKPDTFENSSLGCAMAQYVSLGIYKTPEEATKAMVNYNKVFHPNAEAHEKYKVLFKKVYKKIYPSLKKIYKELSEYQHYSTQKM